MANRKIKAVLFDLGETLLTFGKVNLASIFTEACQLSYQYLRSSNQPVENYNMYKWRNLSAIRFRYLLSIISGKDFDSSKLLKRINQKNAPGFNDGQWETLAWLWYEPLSKLAKTEPDLPKTLQKLINMELKLGILSNTFITSSSLEKHFEQLGISKFFTTKLYSYEFEFRKPDYRIFKIAVERIDEPAANILFVGDRIDNDIIPARKNGMHVVMKSAYTNENKEIPAGIVKINYLNQLPAIIEKINSTM